MSEISGYIDQIETGGADLSQTLEDDMLVKCPKVFNEYYYPEFNLEDYKLKSKSAKEYDALCAVLRKAKGDDPTNYYFDFFFLVPRNEYKSEESKFYTFDFSNFYISDDGSTFKTEFNSLKIDGQEIDPSNCEVTFSKGKTITVNFNRENFGPDIFCFRYNGSSGYTIERISNTSDRLEYSMQINSAKDVFLIFSEPRCILTNGGYALTI